MAVPLWGPASDDVVYDGLELSCEDVNEEGLASITLRQWPASLSDPNDQVRVLVYDCDRLFPSMRDEMEQEGRRVGTLLPSLDKLVLHYDDIGRDSGCVERFLAGIGRPLGCLVISVMYAEHCGVREDCPTTLVLRLPLGLAPQCAGWVCLDTPLVWNPYPICVLPCPA